MVPHSYGHHRFVIIPLSSHSILILTTFLRWDILSQPNTAADMNSESHLRFMPAHNPYTVYL